MTTTARGSARAARTQRTRSAIVEAARTQFVQRGYRATSLRDIAAAAGLSHPGLQKHFPSKADLLAAVIDEFSRDGELHFLDRVAGGEAGALDLAALARANDRIPGYLELFSGLVGEASTRRHPAHEHMRLRYERVREAAAAGIEEGIAHDAVDATRDPAGEAVRIAAAWDGLQLLQQYLPERVAVVPALERYEADLAVPVGWRAPGEPLPSEAHVAAPSLPPFASSEDPPLEAGYRVGRERRARIVADATELFAREGYADTSLRDIAEKVGVSKSTLLHHYGSKEELLDAVLAERDRGIQSRRAYVPRDRAADALRDLPGGAADNSESAPGLIEVYAVLSCEAVPASHPAHEHFTERFRQAVDYFGALFRAAQADGDLPAHRDPEFEAIWLIALWDGLQFQWLYDRDAIDVAAHLRAHLDDVLPRH